MAARVYQICKYEKIKVQTEGDAGKAKEAEHAVKKQKKRQKEYCLNMTKENRLLFSFIFRETLIKCFPHENHRYNVPWHSVPFLSHKCLSQVKVTSESHFVTAIFCASTQSYYYL